MRKIWDSAIQKAGLGEWTPAPEICNFSKLGVFFKTGGILEFPITVNEIEKLNLESFGEETALHILCECQSFSKLRQEIYGTTSLSIPQIISGNIKKTVADMTKFMTKTGVLTRAPIYPESQISPKIKKTWKRDIEELQTWPVINEDQPRAKQRKITDFRIL